MKNGLRTPWLLWPLLWALLGGVAGVALVVADSTGHLPPLFAPPLLALAGAFGGLVGGALFAFLRPRLLGAAGSSSAAGALALGVLCGVVAGGLLYFTGLGALLAYCLVGGGLAGLLAAALSGRPRGRAPGPGSAQM